MNDLRSQLAPTWSGVNIALTVVLFLVAWPLGLVMIAYIVWGRQLGLDLSRPETLPAFGGRLRRAWQAASLSWRSDVPPLRGGTPASGPAGGDPADRVVEDSRSERDALERERRAFEAEKRDWQERQGRAPLDS